jgi:hypothetical protein
MVAIGCYIGGLVALLWTISSSLRWKAAKGVVMEIKTENRTRSHDDQCYIYKFPVIQYQLNSESRLLEFKDENGAFSESLVSGDVVDILFDPKNPSRVILNHGFRRYRIALFLFGIGSIALLPLVIK